MRIDLRTVAISAAATLICLGYGHAEDFIETIAAQAPLQNPEAASDCQKAAESQLSDPLAQLKKKCEDASGQFNVGNVTPSIHRKSCSVYQTVTCSATARANPVPEAKEAAVPADEKPSADQGKPAKAQPKTSPKKPKRKTKTAERQKTVQPS